MNIYNTVLEAFNNAKENKIALRTISIELWKIPGVREWIDSHCHSSLGKRQHAKRLYSALHDGMSFTCKHGFAFGLSETIELYFPSNMKNGCCDCYEKHLSSDYVKNKKEKSEERRKNSIFEIYGSWEKFNEQREGNCIKNNRINHGVDWPAQKPEIFQKTKDTNKENTGYEFPLQNPISMEKFENTCLEIYKETNPMKVPEIYKKAVKTNFKNCEGLWRWGHISQEARKILLDKNKFSIELEKTSIKEMAKNLKVSPNFILTIHHKFKLNIIKFKKSSYENELLSFLKENDIKFIPNDRTQIKPKELDFYFPEHNFAIEFQGDFWHMNPKIFEETDINATNKLTAKQIWERDKKKENICKIKNIDLMQIWESDWNINKEEIKKNILNKLGLVN